MAIRFKSFRNAFISGLLLLAPVGATVFVINLLVVNLGKPTRDYIVSPLIGKNIPDDPWIGWALSLISLLIVLLLVTILGWFSKLLIGRFLVDLFERMVNSLPFVRSVYVTVKQIIETFSQQQKAVFQKTVLIEYPRKGVWVLGFLTSDSKGEVQHRTSSNLQNIFVPTTPNPTSGFLLMVPEEEVTELAMSITDGMKLIISGGAVVPGFDPDTGESIPTQVKQPSRISLKNMTGPVTVSGTETRQESDAGARRD